MLVFRGVSGVKQNWLDILWDTLLPSNSHQPGSLYLGDPSFSTVTGWGSTTPQDIHWRYKLFPDPATISDYHDGFGLGLRVLSPNFPPFLRILEAKHPKIPGKLTWQWKRNLLKMYFLLKMGIFMDFPASYVSWSRRVFQICSIGWKNFQFPTSPWIQGNAAVVYLVESEKITSFPRWSNFFVGWEYMGIKGDTFLQKAMGSSTLRDQLT